MRSRPFFIFLTLVMTAILMAFLSQDGWAQDSDEKTEKAPAKRASKDKDPVKKAVSFEDQLIEGEVQKPELFYLLQKKQFNYGRLIKLRENFIPEMRKTAEEIRR